MSKTPDYTKKAVRAYQAKFDRVNINLPPGLKEAAKEKSGESLNALVNRLLKEYIEKD